MTSKNLDTLIRILMMIVYIIVSFVLIRVETLANGVGVISYCMIGILIVGVVALSCIAWLERMEHDEKEKAKSIDENELDKLATEFSHSLLCEELVQYHSHISDYVIEKIFKEGYRKAKEEQL